MVFAALLFTRCLSLQVIPHDLSGSPELTAVCPHTRTSIQGGGSYTKCGFQSVQSSSSGSIWYSYAACAVTISVCTFTDCVNSYYAGVLYINGDTIAEFVSCRFTRCSASNGGVSFQLAHESHLIFRSCRFDDCHARSGGVAYVSQGNITFSHSKLYRCYAAGATYGSFGGVIYQSYETAVTGIMIDSCEAEDCSSVDSGGVIYLCQARSVVVDSSEFRNCS